MYAHTHTYVCTHTHICTHTHAHTQMHMYIHTQTHMYIDTQTHMHMYMHTNMHTHACAHAHTHAHTHTRTCAHIKFLIMFVNLRIWFQILSLLTESDPRSAGHFLRVVYSFIREVTQRHPQLAQQYLVDPVIRPLQVSVQGQGEFVGNSCNQKVRKEMLCLTMHSTHFNYGRKRERKPAATTIWATLSD